MPGSCRRWPRRYGWLRPRPDWADEGARSPGSSGAMPSRHLPRGLRQAGTGELLECGDQRDLDRRVVRLVVVDHRPAVVEQLPGHPGTGIVGAGQPHRGVGALLQRERRHVAAHLGPHPSGVDRVARHLRVPPGHVQRQGGDGELGVGVHLHRLPGALVLEVGQVEVGAADRVRADVHEPPGQRHGRGQEVRPDGVDLEGPLHPVLGHGPGLIRAEPPGVVDDHVQAAQVADLGGQRPGGGQRREVPDDHWDVRPRVLPALRRAPRVPHHLHAAPGELVGDRRTARASAASACGYPARSPYRLSRTASRSRRCPMAETRRALVTGSSDGIGAAIADELTRRGMQVVRHARNERRAAQCREHARADVPVVVGDLASLASTRALAAQISDLGRLDVIVHNAGWLSPDQARSVTEDGMERTFQINAVGPYLLTTAVPLPRRFVYVSSDSIRSAHLDLSDLQHESSWEPMQVYADSKLAVTALALYVARRYPEVPCNAVHPGWVRSKMSGDVAPLSLEQGADTPVWLACADDPGARVPEPSREGT